MNKDVSDGKRSPPPNPSSEQSRSQSKNPVANIKLEKKTVRSQSNRPPYTHTHARTLTPPQVHLSPGWGRGRKARAPGAAQRARDTGDNGHCGGEHSGPACFSLPSPPALPPTPSLSLHRPARPRGPLRLPGGRMRSANAAPVGFLLNCTAAAAAGRRRRSSRGRHRARTHPARPTAPTGDRPAARSHPHALLRAHQRPRAPRPAGQDAAQPPYFLLK